MKIYVENLKFIISQFWHFIETVYINQIYILVNVISFVVNNAKKDAIFRDLNLAFIRNPDLEHCDRNKAITIFSEHASFFKITIAILIGKLFLFLKFAVKTFNLFINNLINKTQERIELYQKSLIKQNLANTPENPQVEPKQEVIADHQVNTTQTFEPKREVPIVLNKLFRNKQTGKKFSPVVIAFLPISMFFSSFVFFCLFISVFIGLLIFLLVGTFGITALGAKVNSDFQAKRNNVSSTKILPPIKKVEIKKDKQPAESVNGFLLAKNVKFYVENADGKDRNSKIINGTYFFINDFFNYYLREYNGNDEMRFKLILEMKNDVLSTNGVGFSELYSSYNKYIDEDTDAFTKRSSFIDIKNNLFSLSRSNSYTYAKFKQTGIWIRGGRNFNFKTHSSYDLDSIADELAMHLGKVNLN